MATKFYRDVNGKYLGGFDGANPPQGSIEVAQPPEDGRMIYQNGAWTTPKDVESKIIDSKRQTAYAKEGATIDAMVVALWEKLIENDDSTANALQIKREAVKADIPKPQ